MYNKISKAALILFVIANSSYSYAGGDEKMNSSEVISEFNAWSSTLEGNYSYDSIKSNAANSSEYLIIAKLRTHTTAVEAIIVTNEKKPEFLYISSEYKRRVSCSSIDQSFNMDIANEQRLSAIEDTDEENHPYYTVIEKRKNGVSSQFAFSSYYNLPLRKEVDSLESYLLKAMLNFCPHVKVNKGP